MKNRKLTAMIAASAITLSGCAGGGLSTAALDPNLGQAVGGALGAVAGGLAGTQVGSGRGRTAAIIAGTILGGTVGSMIGQTLSTEDQAYSQTAASDALNNNAPGQPAVWRNPQTGTSGQFEATSPSYAYQVPQSSPYYGTTHGQECRDYKQTIYVEGGQYQTATGTACRQPDGTWRIVS